MAMDEATIRKHWEARRERDWHAPSVSGPLGENFDRFESYVQDLHSRWTLASTPKRLDAQVAAYGGSEIPEYVRLLAGTPFIQRLSRCKQLGTTNLAVHLGATHSRLAHVIGSAALTARVLDVLHDQARQLPKAMRKQAMLTSSQQAAVTVFMLLHDIVPLPFGHSVEAARPVLVSSRIVDRMPEMKGKKLDKYFGRRLVEELLTELESATSEKGEVQRLATALTDTWTGLGFNLEELISTWKTLLNPGAPAGRKDGVSLVAPLLDGHIDMDRLDWLPRDCHHLSFHGNDSGDSGDEGPEDAMQRVHGVVSSFTFALSCHEKCSRPDQCTHPEKRVVLALPESNRSAIKRLMKLREELYSTVYENGDKLSIDAAIAHTTFWTLEACDADLRRFGPIGQEHDHERRSRCIDQLAQLTDAQLVDLLSWATTNYPVRRAVLEDALGNRLWTPLELCRFASNESHDGKARDALIRFYGDAQSSMGDRKDRDARPTAEQLRDAASHFASLDIEAQWLILVRHGDPRQSRFEIERKLWQQVISSAIDDKLGRAAKQALEEYQMARFGIANANQGDAAKHIQEELRDSAPPFFIHLPVSSGLNLEVHDGRHREEPPKPDVYFLEEHGAIGPPVEDKAAQELQVFVISPEPIAAVLPKAKEALGAQLRRLYFDDENWLDTCYHAGRFHTSARNGRSNGEDHLGRPGP